MIGFPFTDLFVLFLGMSIYLFYGLRNSVEGQRRTGSNQHILCTKTDEQR